ncbi:MAG: hypothetical protein GX483_03700 [Actinomycetaceae bacterium]|nr:hypothetical protein [Actinomycetaceae bacterium]
MVKVVSSRLVALFAALMLVAGIGMTVLPAQAAPPDPEPSLQGSWLCETDGDCRYLDPNNYPYKSTWLLWNNKWYYLDAGGWMYRTPGEYTLANGNRIDGSSYRFDSSGAMVTGWVQVTYNGDKHWMYYDPDGRGVDDSARYIGGAWYAFNGLGFMMADRTYTIDGKKYRLTASGKAHIGWYQDGSDWYYYGSDGVMYKYQWLASKGKWYYFGKNGVMVAGGTAEVAGKTYRFDASGALITGARWEQDGSEWYYYGADGARYSRQWLYSGGKWYYFHGTHYYGNYVGNRMMRNEETSVDGNWYRFDQSGAMLSSTWYYQDEGVWSDGWQYYDASGKQFVGWLLYNGKWYYFTHIDGIPFLPLNMDINVDGVYYRLDENGAWTGYAF